MGMSTCVEGFRPPDKKWEKMKKVWDTCEEAGIAPPKEVDKFFDEGEPDERGISVELGEECCKDYTEEGRNGFEVEVNKLPKNITHIRFYNSW